MNANHVPGRPRSQEVDAAILRAAVALLAKGGPDAVTINSVARRSGVARASIYLRYPSRHGLLDAALRAAIGRDPFPLSGDLLTDLKLGARQAQAILANPQFRAVLPEVVRDLLRQGENPDTITYAMVAPNQRLIAEEYVRLAFEAGLRTDIDPDLPFHMVVGTLLMSLLAEGVPPTPELALQTAEIVIEGLGVRATGPG